MRQRKYLAQYAFFVMASRKSCQLSYICTGTQVQHDIFIKKTCQIAGEDITGIPV